MSNSIYGPTQDDGLPGASMPKDDDGSLSERGAALGEAERQVMLRRRSANPDDPPTHLPPRDKRGVRPGPDFLGAQGRTAIVQGQVYLVAAILILQLFLITIGLFELLSGRTDILWWIAAASLVAFLVTLLITLWPRRRIVGGIRG